MNGDEHSVPIRFVTEWIKTNITVILCVRPNLANGPCLAYGSRSTFVVCQNGLCEPLVRTLVGRMRVCWGRLFRTATRANGCKSNSAGIYDFRLMMVKRFHLGMLSVSSWKRHPVMVTSTFQAFDGVSWR